MSTARIRDGSSTSIAPIAKTKKADSCVCSVSAQLQHEEQKVARTMQPSISIALMSIEMSSSISSCTFGCTCTHRQHGAEAPRTAAASAAASKAEHRCRPARASGSCSWAPTARKSHSKSFTWRPAASTSRAQRPRQSPLLQAPSHALCDYV